MNLNFIKRRGSGSMPCTLNKVNFKARGYYTEKRNSDNPWWHQKNYFKLNLILFKLLNHKTLRLQLRNYNYSE